MASKSQAVMNLNLKLQSTAVKSQARLIATEIARLELAQAEEHLQIVQVIRLLPNLDSSSLTGDLISSPTFLPLTLKAITTLRLLYFSGNESPPRPSS
jgi:hypothetical protein